MSSAEGQKRAAELANGSLALVGRIANRLRRWYSWLEKDDLRSYAYLGLALAARRYDSRRAVPFANFAFRKALFLAIDQMRKDRLVTRSDSRAVGPTEPLPAETPDPRWRQPQDRMELRDFCNAMLARLPAPQRRLLIMYYGQQMTFREIGQVFGISEAAVCLRHKAAIQKLRRIAGKKRISR